MAGFKEFEARIKSDSAFRAKFAEVKSENDMIQRAKSEGYDLEQLSEYDLDNVAGGMGGRGSKALGEMISGLYRFIENALKDVGSVTIGPMTLGGSGGKIEAH